MKNPVQVINKVLVVSLLISVFFLESCSKQEDLSKLSPAELLSWALNKQKQEADLVKEKERLDQQKEDQRQLQEELKEKEVEIKQREEEAQRILDEKNKSKLDKENLDSEIQRVAKIIQGVANDPDRLEKTIEELTPHGKVINKALKDSFIGHNLRLASNDALTNTDVAVLINHPRRFEGIVKFRLDGPQLSKPQLRKLLSCLDNLRREPSHQRELHICYEQLAVAKVSNLLPLFQIEGRGFDYLTLLGGNGQNDKGIMQSLAQNLDKLAGLQYLRFNSNVFLTLAPSLKLLPDLRYLDLDGCEIGDTGMQALAPCFKGITYLIGLDLSSNNLGPLGAQALASHFKDLPNLRVLRLDLNYKIGLEGIQALASQLRHLAKLGGLSLLNTLAFAGDAGVKVLAPSLKYLTRLMMLKLESNHFGDEGVQDLIPSLQNLSTLNELSLADNHISGIGVKSLVQCLNMVKRDGFRLFLGHNRLGDSEAQSFLNLSEELKGHYICLGDNNISDTVEKKLRQLRHIQWNINSTCEYNPNSKTYTTPPLHVDSWRTSSKESILGTEF